MTYQVEFEMLVGASRTVAVVEGQEVTIQRVKDTLRQGAAVHATVRTAAGVTVWSGKHA
ncbi:hypothetical protein [Phenylobacterium sp.]|uniref:hypothetical protein n=1 Tax=Phenylobacterium sp. TaxID=1871053 RepID=UPI002DF29F6D|nr:hypothetical protein [Phenylobacterium sp.]